MNKKAQYYLLIAILLIVYLLASRLTTVKSPTQAAGFRQLYQNYMVEASKVINTGIHDGNITVRFRNFTDNYLQYSRTKSPNFRLAYALSTDELVLIENRLGENLNITTPSSSFILVNNNWTQVSSPQNMTFYLGGTGYKFAFNDKVQLKVLFKKTEARETLVRIEES